MKRHIKDQGRQQLAPLARALANIGISPNFLTWIGFLISSLAGVLVGGGRFRIAALALLLGGLCDVLDGAVARASGRSTQFGAFLDSTVDRWAEMFFFAGLLYYFVEHQPSTIYALLVFLAAGGSFMVSYTRARAEGLGLECTVGWMERPERIAVLILASLIGLAGIKIALWFLTVLVFWTSGQRMLHVHREAKS